MAISSTGFACFDQFFFPNEWPQENTKNFCHGFIESGGGPAVNAAWLLGLRGEEVCYVGHLHQDLYGQRIIDEFAEAGVDINQVVFSDDTITPLASVLVNRLTGSRTTITRKMQTPPSLTYDQKLKLDDLVERLTASEEPVTILTGGHEAEISEYSVKKLPHAKVVMDGGSLRASNIKLAAWTDYFVISEHFAHDYMSYHSLSTEADIRAALIELNKICRDEAFITLGGKSCAFLKSGMLQIVPSWLCNAVNTTDAGDVFHGAFTYDVHYSWHIDNIILFANLTTAISIEKKGARGPVPDLAVVHYSLDSYEGNLKQYFEE